VTTAFASLAAGIRHTELNGRYAKIYVVEPCGRFWPNSCRSGEVLADRLLTVPTPEVFHMVTMDLAGRFKSNGFYPVADLVNLHVREYPGVH
jgi:hypothetical protein